MGHIGNEAHWGYGVQGYVGHMGNRAQGIWGTRGMGHIGNRSHGQWAPWTMGPMGDLNIFAHNIIKLDILTHLT